MQEKKISCLKNIHNKRPLKQFGIIRDTAYTIQKMESNTLIEHSHSIPNKNNKKDLHQYIRSIVEKSKVKRRFRQHNTHFHNNIQKVVKNDMENSQSIKTNKQIERQKINRKVQMLKNRILPLQVPAPLKFQNQLKQIILINNKRQPRPSKQKRQYSDSEEVNSKLFSAFEKRYDENQIISDYWSKLQAESKITKQAIKMIKQNRLNLLIGKSIKTDQEMKQFQQTKDMFEKQLQPKHSSFHNKYFGHKIKNSSLERINLSKSFTNSANTSFSDLKIVQNQSFKKQDQNENHSRQIVNQEITRYLTSKIQKKNFLNSISKQFIEKQNAIKVYTFVRGGYSLDPSDLQGQFISLKRFNEAKNDFFTLNQFYRKVQLDSEVKVNQKNVQIDNIATDQSFKSLVQVSNMQDKISPSQMLKLMKKSKFVK